MSETGIGIPWQDSHTLALRQRRSISCRKRKAVEVLDPHGDMLYSCHNHSRMHLKPERAYHPMRVKIIRPRKEPKVRARCAAKNRLRFPFITVVAMATTLSICSPGIAQASGKDSAGSSVLPSAATQPVQE